jgi:hypothetical protein
MLGKDTYIATAYANIGNANEYVVRVGKFGNGCVLKLGILRTI